MKKLLIIGMIVVSILPSIGNAFVETAISTVNTLLDGDEPYRKLENEVNTYKQEWITYDAELESDLVAMFTGAIERTANDDERKYVYRKLGAKESFSLDDGKWFESFLARVQENLKNEYKPAYNENYKTYKENFCKTQVAREEKINSLIDETNALNFSAISAKASKNVKGWLNSSARIKWSGLLTKVDAFTRFDQKYGCMKYDSRAMGNGQPVNVLNSLRFMGLAKGSQLSEAQDILRKFAISKMSDRGMFANAFKYKMKNFLAQ